MTDGKLLKTLVVYSEQIEKSIKENRNTINSIESRLGLKQSKNRTEETKDFAAFDNNHIKYAVNLVRDVIKRAAETSEDLQLISQHIKPPQPTVAAQNITTEQHELQIQKYKDEIESLKLKIQQLSASNNVTSSTTTVTPSTPTTPTLETISTTIPTIQDQIVTNSQVGDTLNNTSSYSTTTTETKLGDSSSSISSTLSSSSLAGGGGSSLNIQSDWDTKYQTELQLNEMLSEFLKDDFEFTSLGATDTPTPTPPSTTPATSTSSFSPQLSHTSSSMSLDSPSKPKKAMLTDLLDQIDLETKDSKDSKEKDSKTKKGKFKFF